jgi:dipeptide/tripeptide permease
MTPAPQVSSVPQQGQWLGQPRGLTILFLTEMWEIFSYYGMRALLVYYMTKQLLLGQQQASLIYGVYTATVYFTPIIGGVISDRWLGRRRAVIIGGSIMAIGHFLMASEAFFYVALAAIAIGNGLFLPSLPSQIDGLYTEDDPRRGSAYNVYTSASISAGCWRRWSAAPWARSTAGTGGLVRQASGWCLAWRSMYSARAICRRTRRFQSGRKSGATRRPLLPRTCATPCSCSARSA